VLLEQAECVERGMGRRLGHPDKKGHLPPDPGEAFPEKLFSLIAIQLLSFPSVRAGKPQALDVR
jgi:hypothetical protein